MRDFRFRVWDIKHRITTPRPNQIGYCDFDIKTDGKITREILGRDCMSIDRTTTENQDNYIIQQFTGLLDKNGHEIFEGDIIRGQEYEKPIEVIFCNGGFGLKYTNMNLYFSGLELDSNKLGVVVVGNIFNNPDLLK